MINHFDAYQNLTIEAFDDIQGDYMSEMKIIVSHVDTREGRKINKRLEANALGQLIVKKDGLVIYEGLNKAKAITMYNEIRRV